MRRLPLLLLLAALIVGIVIWTRSREDSPAAPAVPEPTPVAAGTAEKEPDDLPAAGLTGIVIGGANANVVAKRIDGEVRGEPIPTTADRRGAFRYPDLGPGDYYVQARRGNSIGYFPRIRVREGSESRVTIRLHPAAAIEGTVVDEDMVPIAGATVRTDLGGVLKPIFEHLRASHPGLEEHEAAVTDADGRFRIDRLMPGQYDLEVIAPGHLRRVIGNVSAPVDAVRLVVARERTVEVIVKPVGGPMPNDVVVRVEPTGSMVREHVHDGKAVLTLGGLRRGLMRIHAVASGYGEASTDLRIEPGREPDPAVILLRPGTRAFGVLTEEGTDRPIPDVEVIWRLGGKEKVRLLTDKNGRYETWLETGFWWLKFEAPDHVGTGWRKIYHAYGKPIEHDDVLARDVRIVGRVTLHDGRPHPFASVETTVAGSTRWADQDLTGDYRLTGLSAGVRYKLEFGREHELLVTTNEDGTETRADIRFPEMEGYAVKGRIVDENGDPMPNATILTPIDLVEADADGAFSWHVPWPGDTFLAVLVPGRSFDTHWTKRRAGAGLFEVGDLRMRRRPATASGRVVDAGGREIPGATVRALIRGLDDWVTEDRTGSDGHFAVRGPNRWFEGTKLRVDAVGYYAREFDMPLEPDVDFGDVVLTRPGRLVGRLEGEGRTTEFVIVQFRDQRHGLTRWIAGAARRSADRRRFELPRIAAGTHFLRIRAEGRALKGVGEVTVEAGQVTDIGAFELSREAVVEGRVRNATNQTFRRVTVVELDHEVSLGRDGRFRIPNIPAGTWTVRCGSASREVTLEAGETKTIELNAP